MPTSDGRIVSEDLCNGIASERVLREKSVSTPKIQDQAVDIQRQLDPVYAETLHAEDTSKAVTTTALDLVSGTFTIPSWAGEVHILSVHAIHETSPAVTQLVDIVSRLGGVDGNGGQAHLTVGEETTVTIAGRKTVTSPGATIAVVTKGRVGTSTETCSIDAHAMIMGLR